MNRIAIVLGTISCFALLAAGCAQTTMSSAGATEGETLQGEVCAVGIGTQDEQANAGGISESDGEERIVFVSKWGRMSMVDTKP